MDSDAHLDIDMRDFLRILRRRKLVLISTALVVVALGVGLSLLQTPIYSAKATALVPQDVRQSVENSQQFTSPDLLDRAITNEITFAKGDRVRAAVRARLGQVPSILISPVADTDTLEFAAKSSDPVRAALQANQYAQAYLQERRAARTADFLNTAQTLVVEIRSQRDRRTSLKRGDPQIPGIQASIASLQQSLGDLRASGQLSKVGGSVIRNATEPESPVSPSIARNGLVAALLGLVLGVLLAFVRDRFDDSLTSKQELEAASGGRTVMALIPRVSGGLDANRGRVISIGKPSSAAAEAYRLLRASLQIRDQLDGGGLRALAVTSPRAGEGKTSTVANLGVALARAGQRVVIVDYDLRRPRVEAFFGVENSKGVISVLLGDRELVDVLQEIDGQPGLSVMAAGPLPPNPSEVLSLGRAQGLIEELRGQADFVLIDCPPVLPVPDSLAISQMVDGVILVAAARRTSKRSFVRAIELLEQVDAPLVGSVLNEVRGGGEDDYGYGQYYAGVAADDGWKGRLSRWRGRRKTEAPLPAVSQESTGSAEPDAAERLVVGEREAREQEEAVALEKQPPTVEDGARVRPTV